MITAQEFCRCDFCGGDQGEFDDATGNHASCQEGAELRAQADAAHAQRSTLIPGGVLIKWRARARSSDILKLRNLIEFRALLDEFKAEGVLMQAYKEAAEAMMLAPETLRDLIGKVRSYPEEKLICWIEQGISFDHLEKANTLAEVAHKSPAQLLDEAVSLGNATGSPMTVRELTAHAMGEVQSSQRAFVYRRLIIYKQLSAWPIDSYDDDKRARFAAWRDAGKEFLELEDVPDE
jgi:hypothetical protein